MKLTTADLKKKISEWLSNPEYREILEHHTDFNYRDDSIDPFSFDQDLGTSPFEYTANAFEAPSSVKTIDALREHIWELWCNGSKWRRASKEKLKDNWDSYFSSLGSEPKPYFNIDTCGEGNNKLVNYYFNNPKEAEKCILRTFLPNNQLEDNYRLEVITTPDDSEVVGWTVIQD